MSRHPISTWRSAYDHLLDVVFPPRCAACRTWHPGLFCPACQTCLTSIRPPFCMVCGMPFDPLAHSAGECAACRPNAQHAPPPWRVLRSAYTFEGPLRHAVHRLKYQGKIALAAPLAALLDDCLMHQPSGSPAIPVSSLKLLIPVPLHPWRQYRRGYNQSTLLARELGSRLNCPMAELLLRRRYTVPQVELSAGKRARNVAGAFSLNATRCGKLKADPGPVLLIDDVCTTGSTLSECARVLKQRGVREVYALTLARQL